VSGDWTQATCPCGSGAEGAACCARYLASARGGRPALMSMRASDPRVGEAVRAEGAPTAEALMRSRFTAFAVLDAAYLLATWHPSTRPAELDLDPGTRWKRLLIQDTVAGGPADRSGVVEFTAVFQDEDGRGRQHERSSFAREGGRWFYVDGQLGAA
jgi:SEC-C motif domain protein